MHKYLLAIGVAVTMSACGKVRFIEPADEVTNVIEVVEQGIVAIIDPCGDNPGKVDEIIFEMADGSYTAWYSGLGLFVLEPGQTYQTTDNQLCKFEITTDGEFNEI